MAEDRDDEENEANEVCGPSVLRKAPGNDRSTDSHDEPDRKFQLDPERPGTFMADADSRHETHSSHKSEKSRDTCEDFNVPGVYSIKADR